MLNTIYFLLILLINNRVTNLKEIELNNYASNFDLDKDVLAFIHIQKTSGSFWIDNIKNFLIYKSKNSEWKHVCNFSPKHCNFDCSINSEYTNGTRFWDRNELHKCDIHAGVSELEKCISNDTTVNGKVNFITVIRDPQERYISEFHHVKMGATWHKAIRDCTEQLLYSHSCYENYSDWSHVTWKEFLDCEYNLANNRQVRMLANFTQLGCNVLKCWTKSGNCSNELRLEYEEKMVKSAKQTLMSLSFFGIAEYQKLTQYLFEKTFENKFRFMPYFVAKRKEHTSKLEDTFKDSLNEIQKNNHLDARLYKFARNEFFNRVKSFYVEDIDKMF